MMKFLRNKKKKAAQPTVIEIPVGGIDPATGTIYEKKVYPDGKVPIYKETPIDSQTTITEEKEDTEANKTSSLDK